MASTSVDTSVQSASGSYGYYKGTLTVSETQAATKYTYSVTGVTKMQDASYFGVQTVLSGAVSGTASGYATSASSGSYANVPNTTVTKSLTVTRTHSAQTKTFTIQSKGVSVSGVGAAYSQTGTKSITKTIPALASYNVTYNANGGSGTTSSQTKWYGEALTLRNNAFTRTGYTFKNWNTAAAGTGTSYAAGASYTGNAALSLYAQWQEQTATLTYDANGGESAPFAQVMSYTQAAYVTTDSPIRTGYVLDSWNTAADGSGTSYDAGDTFKAADVEPEASTLYAQWVSAYNPPTITNLTAARCDSSGTAADDGAYVNISFDYAKNSASSISGLIEYKTTDAATYTSLQTISASAFNLSTGTWSGSHLGGSLNADTSYFLRVTLTDTGTSDSVSATVSVPTQFVTLDLGAGGKAIGVGCQAPASPPSNGRLEIGMDVDFSGGVAGSIFDAIYPIGSIYMSVNSTDPGLLFGGSWTPIQDTFLLAAGTSWAAGSSGGSKDAIVVSHSHTPMNTSNQFVSIGSGSGAVGVSKVANGSNSTNYFLRVANSDGMARSSTTGSTGDSGTDANMPPYLAVYVWQRTA